MDFQFLLKKTVVAFIASYLKENKIKKTLISSEVKGKEKIRNYNQISLQTILLNLPVRVMMECSIRKSCKLLQAFAFFTLSFKKVFKSNQKSEILWQSTQHWCILMAFHIIIKIRRRRVKNDLCVANLQHSDIYQLSSIPCHQLASQ